VLKLNSKAAIAIVAVIAVAIVAIAAALILTSNNGGDNKPSGSDYSDFNVQTTRNLVFGNANNDNYLDHKDVDFIQSIVDKKTVWDNVKFPLADTDANGIVTSADVTLLKKFLNGEKATMHYVNWYKDKASINYPVKGPVSVDYTTAYDMFVILGAFDQVVGTRDADNLIANYNETLYPKARSQIHSIRDDAGNMDPEKMFALGTKLVVGDPYDATDEVARAMKAMDPEVNVLQLPVNRVMNGIDYTHTIITLGVMMNRQANTSKYIDFVESIESQIKSSITDSGASTKTMLLCYNPSSPNAISLDCLSTFVMQYTDVTNALRLPFEMPVERVARERGGMYTNLEMAKIMEINPEVIIIDTYNLAGADISASEYESIVKEKVEYFKETNAYKNNKIVTIAFEVIGGTAGISCLPLIGSFVWGEKVFNKDQAWDYINNYYRNFTNMGKDIDMTKVRGYAPELWGATV
jgi:ABC-type Fe3+-hydroxamate transport system substrate-binding protein